MKNALFLVATAFVLICSRLPARADTGGDSILGTWHTTDDKSQVQIFKQSNQYFGRILGLKEPNWPANSKLGIPGTPKNDRNDPNPVLRSQPIIGLQIMKSFMYDGKNHWVGGRIYDPETGKTYHGKITLVSANCLELRGFVGISLLGRTVVWTR